MVLWGEIMQTRLKIAAAAAGFALATIPAFAVEMPTDGSKNFSPPTDAPDYFTNETVPESARVDRAAAFDKEDAGISRTTPDLGPAVSADVVSIMNWSIAHEEAISQMETWWRERSIAHEEAISQMETWWRERSNQPYALESKPVPPVTKETISQMETWWQQRTELQPAKTARPPHRHQRHYAAGN